MKRRQFIKTSAAGSLLAPAIINGMPVHTQEPERWLRTLLQPQVDTDHVLVVIYLGGGNDGMNTVIPLDNYAAYNAARSNIAIPQNKVLALSGNNKSGLHPAMSGIQKLYNEGKVNIIQGVSYPNPDFSHFRATDIWTSASDSDRYISTGWAGRYLAEEYPGFPIGYPSSKNPDPLALQIGANLPLMFLGPNAPMSMNVSNPDIFKEWPAGVNDTPGNDYRGREVAYIRNIARQSKGYADKIVEAYVKGTNLGNYPATNYLGDVLKAVARLIKGGLQTRLYLVQVYGFDTHSDQVDATDNTIGAHAQLLQILSDAVYAFQKDLEALKLDQRVLSMTFSEFGRRIKSNSSKGTDHGVAAPMFVMGSQVQTGIIGKNPDIPSNLSVNDNVAMQFDFRSVYSSILKDWFCVSDSERNNILFKNFQTLPIVNHNCSSTGITDYQQNQERLKIAILPNPMVERSEVRITIPNGYTRLHLIDPEGRFVKTIFEGKLDAGEHRFSLDNEGFAPGNYYIYLQQTDAQRTESLVIAR